MFANYSDEYHARFVREKTLQFHTYYARIVRESNYIMYHNFTFGILQDHCPAENVLITSHNYWVFLSFSTQNLFLLFALYYIFKIFFSVSTTLLLFKIVFNSSKRYINSYSFIII